MSLRDQLLKAGLVSEEQVRQSETDTRRKKHHTKKNKKLGAQAAAAEKAKQQQRAKEEATKREQDRKLNFERDAKTKRRANLGRIRQLLEQHRQNDTDAEIPFNFQAGRYIRKLRVTAQQQRQLGMGRLGIVRNPQDAFDYVLLPRTVAEKIAAMEPQALLLLYDESNEPEQDEWDWPE